MAVGYRAAAEQPLLLTPLWPWLEQSGGAFFSLSLSVSLLLPVRP
jgi:hypothetical protein